jgi:hypothetical protein
VNYKASPDWKDAVKSITGGGADVVYDPVGGDVFEQSLRCMAWEGRLLVIGFASGTIPSAKANLLLLKGCSVVGVFWGAFAAREPETNQKNFEMLFAWWKAGKLKPAISHRFPRRPPRRSEPSRAARSWGKRCSRWPEATPGATRPPRIRVGGALRRTWTAGRERCAGPSGALPSAARYAPERRARRPRYSPMDAGLLRRWTCLLALAAASAVGCGDPADRRSGEAPTPPSTITWRGTAAPSRWRETCAWKRWCSPTAGSTLPEPGNLTVAALVQWWKPKEKDCPSFASQTACAAFCAQNPGRCGGNAVCIQHTGPSAPSC